MASSTPRDTSPRPGYISVTIPSPPTASHDPHHQARGGQPPVRRLNLAPQRSYVGGAPCSPISPLALTPSTAGAAFKRPQSPRQAKPAGGSASNKLLNVYWRHGRTMSASDERSVEKDMMSLSPGEALPASVRQRHTGGGGSVGLYDSGGDSGGPSPRSSRRNSLLDGLKGFIDHHRPRAGSATTAELQAKARRSVAKLKKSDKMKGKTESMKSPAVVGLDDNDELFYFNYSAFSRPRSNSTDLLVIRKTSRPMQVEVVGSIDNVEDPYRQYLKTISCYELAPHAGRVIVLDNKLTVHRSFLALFETEDKSVLVWDEATDRLQGMLSQTDFVEMLLEFKGIIDDASSSNALPPEQQELHLKPLGWWMDRRSGGDAAATRLISIDSEKNLLRAVEKILANGIHTMPCFERHPPQEPGLPGPSDMLYLISLSRILKAIYRQMRMLRLVPWILMRLKDIRIGKWSDSLQVVHHDTRLADAIETFVTQRLSSLPVLDADGRPYAVLTKFDVLHLLYASAATPAPPAKSTTETSKGSATPAPPAKSTTQTETSKQPQETPTPTRAYRSLLERTVDDAVRASPAHRGKSKRHDHATENGECADHSEERRHSGGGDTRQLPRGFCSPNETVLSAIQRVCEDGGRKCLFVLDDGDDDSGVGGGGRLLAAVSCSDLVRYVVRERNNAVSKKVSRIEEYRADDLLS